MIQSDHEEEQPVPAIPFAGASYAKNCIPLENKCNVTVVTGGSGGTMQTRSALNTQRLTRTVLPS